MRAQRAAGDATSGLGEPIVGSMEATNGIAIATLVVAAGGSILTLVATLVSGYTTRRHNDKTWLREKKSQTIADYFEAAKSYTRYLNNDVFRTIGDTGMTQEVTDELRRRQELVQLQQISLLLYVGKELGIRATDFQTWMDNEIRGMPLPGTGAFDLKRPHPLVQSVFEGNRLLLELVNPVREELGSPPLDNLVVQPSPNRYGR